MLRLSPQTPVHTKCSGPQLFDCGYAFFQNTNDQYSVCMVGLPSFRFVLIMNIVVYLHCFVCCRPSSSRFSPVVLTGISRSSVWVQRLRGCGPPDGGYSVVKVQVGGKVLPYIRTFTPPKVKALFKIPFTYSEVRRGKSQPRRRTFS